MPASQWALTKAEAIRSNRWISTIDSYLRRFHTPLALRMEMLEEAASNGEVGLAAGRFQIPRLKATPIDPAVNVTRADLFGSIGTVQIPEVIVSIDAVTRFSAVLLGRDISNAAELEALYAALLALGPTRLQPTWRACSTGSATIGSNS